MGNKPQGIVITPTPEPDKDTEKSSDANSSAPMALNSYLHQKGRRTLQPMVSMCLPAANPQAHDSLLPSMVKWQRGVLEPSQGSASQSYDKQSRRHHGWIELFQTKKGGCNAAERKKQGKHSLDSLEKIWLAHIIAPTSNCAS